MPLIINTPRVDVLITPLLASLPVAAISSDPPSAILPFLSPILRQRVKILSSFYKDSWLSLLCYDDEIASKLKKLAFSSKLEPHPVSGQVEIDWDSDTHIQFRRVDSETFEALVSLPKLDLTVKLVWCENDTEGINDYDSWRIGEIGVCTTDAEMWGTISIPIAEQEFMSKKIPRLEVYSRKNSQQSLVTPGIEEERQGDDDDKYWAQYDNISSQTPRRKLSPETQKNKLEDVERADEEYYASYDIVQPALDSHDPDEAVDYGLVKTDTVQSQYIEKCSIFDPGFCPLQRKSSEPWIDDSVDSSIFIMKKSIPHSGIDGDKASSGCNIVARPEQQVVPSIESENAIKTHISTSMKSLYRLARSAGIEQGEFDRVVRTQLDLMCITGEDVDDF